MVRHQGSDPGTRPSGMDGRTRGSSRVLAVDRYPAHRVGNGLFPFPRPVRPWAIFLAVGDPGGAPGRRGRRPGDAAGHVEIVGVDPPAPADVARWVVQRVAQERLDRGTVVVLRDAALADELRRALPAGLAVELVEGGHPAIEALRDSVRPSGDRLLPPLGQKPRVPPGTIRSFHEACRLFVEAAPWRFLVKEELLRVDVPTAPVPDARFFRVLGRGDERGLLFFRDSRHHYADLEGKANRPPWIATMLPLGQLPPSEEETWERLGLPPLRADGREWLPFPVRPAHGRHRRPDARLLAWFDLVLRAMAATRPADVDAGAWTVVVDRAGEEVEVALAHTGILFEDPPGPGLRPEDFADRVSVAGAFKLEEEGGDLADEAALEEAVDELAARFFDWDGASPLAYGETPVARALDIAIAGRVRAGRSGLALIEEALRKDPDCPEALRRLAEVEPDPAKAEDLLRRAARVAMERWGAPGVTGPGADRPVDPRQRVSARVLVDLGRLLLEAGRPGEAIGVLRQAAGPPPKGDPLGARIPLLRAALEAERFELAAELAEAWHRRDSQFLLAWRWVRLFLEFRDAGGKPGPGWRARLEHLVAADPRVAFHLLWRFGDGTEEPDLLAWALVPALDRFPGILLQLYQVTVEPPARDDLDGDEHG